MDHAQTDHLIKMINQIAANIPAEADSGRTAASVAAHIRRFWTPKMIRQIGEHLAGGENDLSPVAREAVVLLNASSQAMEKQTTT